MAPTTGFEGTDGFGIGAGAGALLPMTELGREEGGVEEFDPNGLPRRGYGTADPFA